MDKTQIFLVVSTLIAVSVRLYLKYKKKNEINPGTGTKSHPVNTPMHGGKDDDYEPYSKK
jgi:hypothetical protein